MSYFTLFRNGLKEDIEKLKNSIKEMRNKRELLIERNQGVSSNDMLSQARLNYMNHFNYRKIQTYEKYTLEHDVMFSSVKTIKKKENDSQDSGLIMIIDSKIAETIPISGRPVKDIFTDMLISSSQNRSLNLSSYHERVYKENDST